MKPNATKIKAKATIEAEKTRAENVWTLLQSGWTTVDAIAKAMKFTKANVYQWYMESEIARRYISGNQARLLEERLKLFPGSLDLPGFGGHVPSKSVVQLRLEDAESILDEALKRTNIHLTKLARQELIESFSHELKNDRKVTPQAADLAVRLKRRS